MKFHDFAHAPNPRRTRILIAEKGLDIENIQIDLANLEQKGDAFKKINPNCTVPVLLLDDGTALTENVAIVNYLEDVYPEPPMLGSGPVERALVQEWNAKVEQEGIHAVTEALRNAIPALENRAIAVELSLEQIPALIDRGTKRTKHFMSVLDNRLENREYIAIDSFSWADISALVFVEFAARLKLDLTEKLPNVTRWHKTISARPSCQD